MIAACLLAGLLAAQATTGAAIDADTVVVVLPFENPQGISRLHWIREGASLLVGDLVRAGGATVVSRDERVLAYERLQLPVTATLSRASAIRVGHAVGAVAVVTGQLALDGDQLRIRARVIRLDNGRLSAESSASGRPEELFELARRVATLLMTSSARDPWRPPPSLGAFELFTRGLVAETPAAGQAYLEQALEAEPDYDAVRLALWELHTDQGAYAEALASAERVDKTSPLHADARYAAAMSLLQLRRFDEAFSALRVLQDEVGPRAAVANALGVVQVRRGATPQTGRATYYFNQATEMAPAEGDYFFNLGYAYWLDRDANGAAYWLREAVRRDPGDDEAHFLLGEALRRIGAPAESARERELAHRLSSRFAAWEARAAAGGDPIPRDLERLHDRLTRPSARVDAIIASAGQRNQIELAAFHLDAARRAYSREADAEAVRELRRAVFLSPYLAEAHLLLGRVHLRGGRADEAVQALKIAIWSEESVEALVALGEAYLALGDTRLAHEAVDRALVLDPKSAPAAALKARLPAR